MKKLIIAAIFVAISTPAYAEDMMIRVNVNRVCAKIVGIPYASDNFSDAEWEKFKSCVRFMRKFDGIE
jgi:hypothetical protein